MAKKCMIARERLREKLSQRARATRQEIKAIINSETVEFDEKLDQVKRLNKRRRDESASRHVRRCRSCGRPHAVYRKFGLCRICLRNHAMRGDIPGLVKSSW